MAEEAKPAREFSRYPCLEQSKVKKYEHRELRGLAKTAPAAFLSLILVSLAMAISQGDPWSCREPGAEQC